MHNLQHSQALLEREVCELAHFFFHKFFLTLLSFAPKDLKQMEHIAYTVFQVYVLLNQRKQYAKLTSL